MAALFIFHRTLGSNDEDATAQERCEKVLYFQASRSRPDPELQMGEVATMEAMIDLCQTFGATQSCDFIHTSSRNYALLECEPDIWMALSVPASAPSGAHRGRNSAFKIPLIRAAASPRAQSCADNVNGFVMQRFLRSIYESFIFLHGRISDMLIPHGPAWEIKRLRKVLRKARKFQREADEGDLVPDAAQAQVMADREKNEDRLGHLLAASPADGVRRRMSGFFPLATACVNFSNLHLFYGLPGLLYLAVDKATYLSIQYFMRLLSIGFPQIRSTLLLFNGQLLWTSLSQRHTLTVFNYIRLFLSSETDTKTTPGYLPVGASGGERHDAQKATPWDGVDAYAPRCYLQPEEEGAEQSVRRLLAYQLNRTTLVCIADDVAADGQWTEQDLLTFCGDLESFASVELERLATALTKSATVAAGEAVMGSPASPKSGIIHEKADGMRVRQAPGLPRGVQAGPFEAQVNGEVLRKARFLVVDGSSLITKASQSLTFPAVLFPKQQHEQLIDQLKLLHVYQSNNIVLGPREIGQGLSIGVSRAMNDIYSQFCQSRDESMEYILSIPASIIPFLKNRSNASRQSKGNKGSSLYN